jgi:hypothetical protein
LNLVGTDADASPTPVLDSTESEVPEHDGDGTADDDEDQGIPLNVREEEEEEEGMAEIVIEGATPKAADEDITVRGNALSDFGVMVLTQTGIGTRKKMSKIAGGLAKLIREAVERDNVEKEVERVDKRARDRAQRIKKRLAGLFVLTDPTFNYSTLK